MAAPSKAFASMVLIPSGRVKSGAPKGGISVHRAVRVISSVTGTAKS